MLNLVPFGSGIEMVHLAPQPFNHDSRKCVRFVVKKWPGIYFLEGAFEVAVERGERGWHEWCI